MRKPSPVGMMLDCAYGRKPAHGERSGAAASRAADPLSPDGAAAALVAASKAWWESRRPVAWSLEQHLASSTAGCTDTPQERALAETVAHWLRQGG